MRKDIPFVNRQSPVFEELSTLLASSSNITIDVKKSKSIVITLIRPNGSLHPKPFTFSQISEICPILLDLLAYSVGTFREQAMHVSSVKLAWEHCLSPGLCVRVFDDQELYIRELLEISAVNNIHKSLVAKACAYSFGIEQISSPRFLLSAFLEKFLSPREQATKRKNVVTNIRTYSLNTEFYMELQLLEDAFPGFTLRANTAMSLGLSPADVAQHAAGCSNPKNLQEATSLASLSL